MHQALLTHHLTLVESATPGTGEPHTLHEPEMLLSCSGTDKTIVCVWLIKG